MPQNRRLLLAFILAMGLHFIALLGWKQETRLSSLAALKGDTSVEVDLASPHNPITVPESNKEQNAPAISSENALSPISPSPISAKRAVSSPLPLPSPISHLPPQSRQPPTSGRTNSMHKKSGANILTAGGPGIRTTKAGYLYNPQPSYPLFSQKSGHQGIVLLHVQIDKEGKVSAVSVIKSSGYMELDQQALITVRHQWKFKPAKKNGIPIATEVAIPIHFSLHNRP